MDDLEPRLFSFLKNLDLGYNGNLDSHTALFQNGVLDSLSLFNLAEWIEDEVGKPLDLTQIDILEEWKTIGCVLDFIKKHRNQ